MLATPTATVSPEPTATTRRAKQRSMRSPAIEASEVDGTAASAVVEIPARDQYSIGLPRTLRSWAMRGMRFQLRRRRGRRSLLDEEHAHRPGHRLHRLGVVQESFGMEAVAMIRTPVRHLPIRSEAPSGWYVQRTAQPSCDSARLLFDLGDFPRERRATGVEQRPQPSPNSSAEEGSLPGYSWSHQSRSKQPGDQSIGSGLSELACGSSAISQSETARASGVWW